MGTGDGGRGARPGTGLLLAAIVLLGFQLRSPLVALAPIASAAQAGWDVNSTAFGLLTSVPVLCFGLATPLALFLQRRVGLEASILVCLGGIVAATVLRSIDGFGVALAAVVLLGLSITIGNVLVPTIIRRDVPRRGRPAATSAYSVSVNVGTWLTALGTVPLSVVFGWRVAAAAWSVAGIATGVVWIVLLQRARALPQPVLMRPPRYRPDRLAILLSLGFACQGFSYYGVTTWLPTLLADERGYSAAVAGTASSVFQIAGIVGAIGVPLLTLRFSSRTVLAIIGLLWISLPVGLLVAPEHFVLFAILGGAGQGGGFAAIFTIIAEVGGDLQRTTALSAFVQTIGYIVASVAPPVVGAAHQLTGAWTGPMVVVLVATVGFLVLNLSAATLAGRREAG
ncbi:MAG TPA: MFS transporter [Amnibacterium sp.]|uniref:MFS transporter n=1 Tax=Amnibacterium sp. TaxID=1872496 RepID=UPI002F957309